MAVPGINLAGYLDAGLGLGEAARQVGGALEAAGALVAPLALTHASAPRDGAGRPARGEPVHDTTLVCTTPEGMPAARDELGAAAFEGRRVIGLWWWEVQGLPGRWARSFDGVDEVWAGSRFVADVLGAVAPVPVVAMPLPVASPVAGEVDRAALGLPGEAFLFGFVFDHASGFARKNPLGLIEAFTRAFPGDGRGSEHLVVKAGGGERHPEEHAALLVAAAAHPRVHVLEGHLPAAQKNALIAALDCYVSLHRSEGFGLTIAEAMLLGVPVVATDFGGSRDLVTPFTGWPVDWRAQAIGPGQAPYPPEGTWAAPDVEHAAAVLREVRGSPEEAARRAARAREDVGREHAPAAAGAVMVARLATLAGLPVRAGGTVPA
ncbi:MAG TPA: glycosyltransferase family 4 protein, partial [Solirubrobacteraceae bacterium]|nr:glycosyltransferase family 4 protein [Solirubrobacteraceae bacterium]